MSGWTLALFLDEVANVFPLLFNWAEGSLWLLAYVRWRCIHHPRAKPAMSPPTIQPAANPAEDETIDFTEKERKKNRKGLLCRCLLTSVHCLQFSTGHSKSFLSLIIFYFMFNAESHNLGQHANIKDSSTELIHKNSCYLSFTPTSCSKHTHGTTSRK